MAFLQMGRADDYRRQIAEMRLLPARQMPTLRGSIMDRRGRKLAYDKPVFYLHVSYQLTRLLDDNFWQANIIRLAAREEISAEKAELILRQEYEADRAELMRIIERFADLGQGSREKIYDRIFRINEQIWRYRQFTAWSRNFPDSQLKTDYRARGMYVPQSEAIEEFATLEPDRQKRVMMTLAVDLAEMHEPQPLVELKTEAELIEAQRAFTDIEGVNIYPQEVRYYPYGSAGCQVIGRVGPAFEEDNELFDFDRYSDYQPGDMIGRDGVEWVCEPILRGRRGEKRYDIEGSLIEEKVSIFGNDVRLSLDIELQEAIELAVSDPNDPAKAVGAVVIETATGQALAIVSVPVYNLNTVRFEYNEIKNRPGEPMTSKATRKIYPPGSSIKPLVLAAGLEEGKVAPGTVISCPHKPAPRGWPNCLQYRRFGSCHDWKWDGHGGNNAVNAIRGSCNIYFSRLADMLDSRVLQKWLWEFGCGRTILAGPDYETMMQGLRRDSYKPLRLAESAGQIQSAIPPGQPDSFDEVGDLKGYEKRMFGIGQGGLRVTTLQVAAAMACISRGGVFIRPTVFMPPQGENSPGTFRPYGREIGLSDRTVRTVKDGMYAVVNQWGGTARSAFEGSFLLDKDRGMDIYGKTGSTERPNHAWFAGFVEDKTAGGIALAVLVEGGQAGSSDAAPLGREIIRLCSEMGYIGQ